MLIHPSDTVEVSLLDGQKYARRDIAAGEQIIKYGFPIGAATCAIKAGELVHTHNLKTLLSGKLLPRFERPYPVPPCRGTAEFSGYLRRDGSAGIRNEVWILPTVGCINGLARRLAAETGAFAYTHPYGCSQLGGDLLTTQKILSGLIRHPNAGGVLVLGLGCENNGMDMLKAVLGEYDPDRVKFLVTQDAADEVAEAKRLIAELFAFAGQSRRQMLPISKLRIGLKCGGSDGFSGLTANPLVGRVAEELSGLGATALLTEVPEMFGGEEVLLSRAVSREVFDRAVHMMQSFRDYFTSHGEGIADNPSPGNIRGGITTLEEKSLGCVQKGGNIPVTGVLDFGEVPTGGGLQLVNGPGNDVVACTNLTAAGAQIILFTTGRGTPLGAPVPTLKISTNTPLFERKPGWIDFDAGVLAAGEDSAAVTARLRALIFRTAEGLPTKSEQNQTQEISIFKDGVIL